MAPSIFALVPAHPRTFQTHTQTHAHIQIQEIAHNYKLLATKLSKFN